MARRRSTLRGTIAAYRCAIKVSFEGCSLKCWEMPRTIAVDLDEVLGKFIAPLCEFHNAMYGTELTQDDFFSYRFCEVWGGDDQQATEKVHGFFASPYFEDIPIVLGAKEALQKLRDLGYELVVVTSRQLVIEEVTRSWLKRHFPADMFRQIAFGNHWGLEGKKIKKVDLCRELGASVLIDDSLAYAREVASVGMKALLFDLEGRYMWNKSDALPPGVIRVFGWDDALEQLLS